MNSDIVSIVISILGSSVFTAFVTLWFTRRKIAAETDKVNAETASEQVDATSKVSDLLKDMQIENVALYRQNTELEKQNTDKARTIEILTARLEARDQQLGTVNEQMKRLSSLAEQAPIIETLRKQLDAVTSIAAGFQATQAELQKVLTEKEKTMQELQQTNRDLEMKKVPKV